MVVNYKCTLKTNLYSRWKYEICLALSSSDLVKEAVPPTRSFSCNYTTVLPSKRSLGDQDQRAETEKRGTRNQSLSISLSIKSIYVLSASRKDIKIQVILTPNETQGLFY